MSISPLPRNVKWTERKHDIKLRGKVIDEVKVEEKYPPFGDFCKLLQVIRKEGEKEDIIRLGYYVKDYDAPDSEYRWGSQTTFTAKRNNFYKLLKKAKKEGFIKL